MNYLIFIIMMLFQLGGMASNDQNQSRDDASGRVDAENSDIRFFIKYEKIYPDDNDVQVHYCIENHSTHVIAVERGNITYDMRLELIGPDEKRVAPYPYSYSCLNAAGTYKLKLRNVINRYSTGTTEKFYFETLQYGTNTVYELFEVGGVLI